MGFHWGEIAPDKWNYNPYKWPYYMGNWGEISPISGAMRPLGFISPSYPLYVRPSTRAPCHSSYNDCSGPSCHLVEDDTMVGDGW